MVSWTVVRCSVGYCIKQNVGSSYGPIRYLISLSSLISNCRHCFLCLPTLCSRHPTFLFLIISILSTLHYSLAIRQCYVCIVSCLRFWRELYTPSRLSTDRFTRPASQSSMRPSPIRPLVVVRTPYSYSYYSSFTKKPDFLQVALDVTSNGQLQLPPYDSNPASAIYNITIFLSSYTTGKNFTISNGTASANNASLGEIMAQEPGSTVKHVNWVWPDCLVGDGAPSDNGSARGLYNVRLVVRGGVRSANASRSLSARTSV